MLTRVGFCQALILWECFGFFFCLIEEYPPHWVPVQYFIVVEPEPKFVYPPRKVITFLEYLFLNNHLKKPPIRTFAVIDQFPQRRFLALALFTEAADLFTVGSCQSDRHVVESIRVHLAGRYFAKSPFEVVASVFAYEAAISAAGT